MSIINNQISSSLKNLNGINIFNILNVLNNNNKRNFHSSFAKKKHHKELEFKIYRWVNNYL